MGCPWRDSPLFQQWPIVVGYVVCAQSPAQAGALEDATVDILLAELKAKDGASCAGTSGLAHSAHNLGRLRHAIGSCERFVIEG